jgi:hypothetical protein
VVCWVREGRVCVCVCHVCVCVCVCKWAMCGTQQNKHNVQYNWVVDGVEFWAVDDIMGVKNRIARVVGIAPSRHQTCNRRHRGRRKQGCQTEVQQTWSHSSCTCSGKQKLNKGHRGFQQTV